jgi:hypothetical protein
VTARAPHSAETRARIRARLQAFWANPENRQRQSEITKARMARPGVSERIAERTAAALADPIVKRRHVEGLTARFADPILREKISINTKAGMKRWRGVRLEAAAVVLRQLPKVDREQAMAALASAAYGGSKP